MIGRRLLPSIRSFASSLSVCNKQVPFILPYHAHTHTRSVSSSFKNVTHPVRPRKDLKETVLHDGSLLGDRTLEQMLTGTLASPVSRSGQIRDLCQIYRLSDDEKKQEFLLHLCTHYGVERNRARELGQDLSKISDDDSDVKGVRLMNNVRFSLQPRFIDIFHAVGKVESGIKFLVDLRADLLGFNAEEREPLKRAKLQMIERELRHLLSVWFSVGLLTLQQVTWNSPSAIIEKIAAFESVHPIKGWSDMKQRLGHRRRCFIFTHPSLSPDDPLVAVHVALTNSIPNNVKEIIQTSAGFGQETLDRVAKASVGPSSPEQEDVRDVNTALFYSISSPQRGLNGIDMGMQMIRTVVQKLREEYPRITSVATLSPIPGFRDYLIQEIDAVIDGTAENVSNFFTEEEMAELEKWLFNQDNFKTDNLWQLVKEAIQTNSWIHDDQMAAKLYQPLMRKCTHYLYGAKRNGYALNFVANFHMKNGAVMWRLNWRADMSPRGLSNSCGIMVNYYYPLTEMDQNSERYILHKEIPTSESFFKLV